MQPFLLTANALESFYPGDGRIGRFRGDSEIDPLKSEDWIASTTVRTGSGPIGLTTLPDGSLLAERIERDPEEFLGPDHTALHGARSALLVKLLDAGRRLPLHVHPDRSFAGKYLGSDMGKTEAWLVLHAESGASAHLGFRRDVAVDELDDWVSRQDVDALLGACNQVPVRPGDVLFCPGGYPHAIGRGLLILEIQEMTDFSIMLEWAGYPLDPDSLFLGLERAVALGAVHRAGLDGDALRALQGRCVRTLATGDEGVRPLLPPAAKEYFGAEQVIVKSDPVELDAQFSVMVVNEGKGTLSCEGHEPMDLASGQTILIPYAAGRTVIEGAVSAIRCFPGA